jgi:SAM-dependent methyltransferase
MQFMSDIPRSNLLRRVAARLRKASWGIASKAINNVVMNNLAIQLGLESSLKDWQNPYRTFRPNMGKNLQENAGFSDRPEINEVVERMHIELAKVARQCEGGQSSRPLRALDIGCGPGLYLRDFPKETWDLTGLDLNEGMCQLARETCPQAKILNETFLSQELTGPFHLIYSISVLMYVGRTNLDPFFRKISQLLVPGGMLLINYSHAISRWDLWYPDLSYIQYSPRLIQHIVSRHLEVVDHRHAVDDRSIDLVDQHPYLSQNSTSNKSFRNSSLLIARRPLL